MLDGFIQLLGYITFGFCMGIGILGTFRFIGDLFLRMCHTVAMNTKDPRDNE